MNHGTAVIAAHSAARESLGIDAFGRMTRQSAADALGYSPGTLANWATDGIGPRIYRSRGKVFYLASEVEAFALGEVRAA